jgi:cytochrome c
MAIMKKIFVLFTITAAVACGGEKTKTEEKTTNVEATTAATAANDISANPDYQKGLELIGKSDCLTCHKVSDKLIGPSYKEVAAKYDNTPDNIKMLAGKIIKGGQGVWGAVPMTAHPQLSEADAEQMVKYIMLLKK